MFSRVQPLGWALYETLTSAQMNALDIDHTRAVDGYAGGTYDPSTAVTFGAGKLKAQPAYNDFIFANPYLQCVSTAITRYYSPSGAALSLAWEWGAEDFPRQTDPLGGSMGLWASPRPSYGTLTSAGVYLIGGTGHSAMPANPPVFGIGKLSGAGMASLGTQVDTSANYTAYESLHAITITGLSETITNETMLRFTVAGEYGANAEDYLRVIRFFTVISTDKNYPG